MNTGMDLKVRRIRAKVTQAQIAGLLGMSRSWVAKVERTAEPKAHHVNLYMLALGTFANVSDVA